MNSKSCATMACTIQLTHPSSDICQYYFSPLDNDGVLRECRKCCKEKIKSGGWTNLHSHLKSCVGKDYCDQYKAVVLSRNTTQNKGQNAMNTGGRGKGRAAFSFDSYVLCVSEAEQEMTEWINYLVMKNLPVSLVDCPLTQQMSKLKPVSSKLIRKLILSLVSIVREDLKLRLPDKFILIFDGWTEGADHYIGIWASYNTSVLDKSEVDNDSTKETPVQSLLSIRPLLEGGIQVMTA